MPKIFITIFLTLFSSQLFAIDFANTKQLATSGDASAQFDLATMYDVGEGVKRDLKQAAIWYRKAAEQGEVAAQYNLAIMYDMGEGVPKNIVKAYAWMATAEMFGYQGARENSKGFYQRMTPTQQDKGEALVIEIVNRITKSKESPEVMPEP